MVPKSIGMAELATYVAEAVSKYLADGLAAYPVDEYVAEELATYLAESWPRTWRLCSEINRNYTLCISCRNVRNLDQPVAIMDSP